MAVAIWWHMRQQRRALSRMAADVKCLSGVNSMANMARVAACAISVTA